MALAVRKSSQGQPSLASTLDKEPMLVATMTAQQIGGVVWWGFLACAGSVLAVTGPKYLHLIDKAFPDKARNNPDAAAKQVKVFRAIGCALVLLGIAKIALVLLRG